MLWRALQLALVLLTTGLGLAGAQDISLQTELDLRMMQLGTPDGETSTAFRVEPRYQLSWRGPLQGGTNIYADVGSTGGLVAEPGVFGTEQSYQLNLHSQGQALNLNASLSRSNDRFSLLQPDGSHQTFGSTTDAISLNGILSYPNYPLVSFQHQRARSSSGFGGSSLSTATILGANYDVGPLRFSLDRQWLDVRGGQTFRSMQYGVNFNTALTPVAQLTAQHFGGTFQSAGLDGAGFDSNNQTTTVRLSALPTPFLVLDGELTHSLSSQERLGANFESSSLNHALVLRSDPLPGVRLDVSERGQFGRSGEFRFDAQQFTVDVGVTPAPQTQLLALYSTSRFKTFGDPAPNKQDQQQISFAMPLWGTMDLHSSYYHTSRSRGDSGYESSSLSVGVVGDLNERLIARATYRSDRERTFFGGSEERLANESLQLQANWLPNENWDLTLGLDAIRSRGLRRTTTIQPIVETRWNMTTDTTLTLRYHLSQIREFERLIGDPLAGFSGTSSFLSGRISHQLSDTDSFELLYDDQRVTGSLSRFRRVLEFRWLKRF